MWKTQKEHAQLKVFACRASALWKWWTQNFEQYHWPLDWQHHLYWIWRESCLLEVLPRNCTEPVLWLSNRYIFCYGNQSPLISLTLFISVRKDTELVNLGNKGVSICRLCWVEKLNGCRIQTKENQYRIYLFF